MFKIDINAIPALQELTSLYNVLTIHGKSRIVGGCIRDMILGLPVGDIDLATTILPEKVMEILSANKIKAIPTGLAFGTVTAIIGNISFEITTLRKDISCDGRRATVVFTDDWREDAERRDFTINAMYADFDGVVTDFFDGAADLKQKVIRFIGDPKQRIQEDFLRILRYFRFYSYIGVHNIDQRSMDNAIELSSNLHLISGERIKIEMFKLLSGKFVAEAFEFFHQSGVWQHISMPIAGYTTLPLLSNYPLVNLAAIFKISDVDINIIKALAKRWRLSNNEAKELIHLYNYQYDTPLESDLKLHKRQCYMLGQKMFQQHLILQGITGSNPDQIFLAKDIIHQSLQWTFPMYPIAGQDLLDLGLGGAEVGTAIHYLRKAWIDSDFLMTKAELLQLSRAVW